MPSQPDPNHAAPNLAAPNQRAQGLPDPDRDTPIRRTRATKGSTRRAPAPKQADDPLRPAPHESWATPTTPDELHAWIVAHTDVSPARGAMFPAHQSAMEYLCWSFFEGRAGFAAAQSPPNAAPPPEPGDCVVWANRGGGKTFLGALATVLDMIFKPGIEIRILGGSMDQSRRMFAHLRRLFERPALAPLVDGRVTEKGVRLHNHSEVEMLAQSQASVRGTRVQKLRCDEVELFDPEVWEAAQLVTKGKSIHVPGVGPVNIRGSVECFSTMHRPHGIMSRIVRETGWNDPEAQAPDPALAPANQAPIAAASPEIPARRLFKWGVADVIERCPPRHACFTKSGDESVHCPLWEECKGRAKTESWQGGHVTIDDAVRMKGRVSQATWDTEMLCRRPRRSDSVFSEFKPRKHVVPALPWDRGMDVSSCPPKWIAGMDFGFRAPSVVLLAAVDSGGVVWIAREWSKTETILEDHVAAIMRGLSRPGEDASPGPGWQGKPDWIGIDPAGRQRSDQTGISAGDVLTRAGLEILDAKRGRDEGLELVRARLSPAGGRPPRLFIHSRCKHLIECLEKYHYPPGDPESMVPVKDDSDHAADALRYLVQNLDRPKYTRAAAYIAH